MNVLSNLTKPPTHFTAHFHPLDGAAKLQKGNKMATDDTLTLIALL